MRATPHESARTTAGSVLLASGRDVIGKRGSEQQSGVSAIFAALVKKMPDNSHRYRLYEPVLFLHSKRASQADAGCSEFHSTHGGFDGPYGIKVEIEARAQEGRACERQASLGHREQPGEEGQARRREAAGTAGREAQDGEEGAQEIRAQSGTEGGRQDAGHDVADVIDTASLAADGAEACGPADVAPTATSGSSAIAAAAAVIAVFRLELIAGLLGA
jgi:hypothetical protein